MEVDFIKYRSLSFCLSLMAIVALCVLLSLNKLNIGVDFAGGVVCEVKLNGRTAEDIQTVLGKGVLVQGFEGTNSVLIKAKQDYWANDESILRRKEFCGSNIQYVGSQLSDDFLYRGFIALICSFMGVYFYLLFRFDNAFAISGVIALVHDCLVTLGFVVGSRMEINLMVVTALLTIIGYSINDSVVIFDRIRENLKMSIVGDLRGCVNRSIADTLSRTIYTSVTTLLAAITLVFFDNGQIAEFSMIITFGIIVGTYSSIFLSVPLYLMLKERQKKRKDVASTKGRGSMTTSGS